MVEFIRSLSYLIIKLFSLLFLLQAHEAVICGQYPAPEETLQFLAALRLQYLLGDHGPGASLPEMSQVFPMTRLRARVQNAARSFAPGGGGGGSVAERSGTAERKRSSFLEGTLRRSFRSGSMSRQRLEEENNLEAWLREEVAAARTCVTDKWRKLQGMKQEQAMVKYMALVKEWQGYGSTLFDVEVSSLFTCSALNHYKLVYREKQTEVIVQFFCIDFSDWSCALPPP